MGGLKATSSLHTCMLVVSGNRSGSVDIVPGAGFGCSSGHTCDGERDIVQAGKGTADDQGQLRGSSWVPQQLEYTIVGLNSLS